MGWKSSFPGSIWRTSSSVWSAAWCWWLTSAEHEELLEEYYRIVAILPCLWAFKPWCDATCLELGSNSCHQFKIYRETKEDRKRKNPVTIGTPMNTPVWKLLNLSTLLFQFLAFSSVEQRSLLNPYATYIILFSNFYYCRHPTLDEKMDWAQAFQQQVLFYS